MYVYLIQSGTSRKAPVKIGMSDNPEKRIKQLQTGNPEMLRLIMSIKCNSREHAYNLESTLHTLMAKKSIINEWFFLDKRSVLSTLNRIAKMNISDNIVIHQELLKPKTEDTIKADSVRVKALNGTLDDSIKATKKRMNAQTKQLRDMERVLTTRKKESGLMQAKLIELGYKGCLNQLLGRKLTSRDKAYIEALGGTAT
ncbi:MAG: GIY-YIG nuclease family protein [Psychromonas sp.]|nr:GIY-YIG nuclease family protein [Psychromonas sp.]